MCVRSHRRVRDPGKVTNDRDTGTRHDPLTIVLLVGCVALAACVILLAWQNLSLKRQLAAGPHAGVDPDALAAGEFIEPFEVVTAAGESVRVSFDEGQQRTLLLVFSSTCPACESNMPIWNELLAGERPASVRVLGFQTDLAAGTTPHDGGPPCPIYAVGPRARPPFNRLPYVPATVVVDHEGRVRSVWFGVLGADQQAELRREIAEPGA